MSELTRNVGHCFAVGNEVTIITDIKKVKELQREHGEWIDILKDYLGKKGKIVKIDKDGDVRVRLEGGCSWTFHPHCLRLTPDSVIKPTNTVHTSQDQGQGPSGQNLKPPSPIGAQMHVSSVPIVEDTVKSSQVQLRNAGWNSRIPQFIGKVGNATDETGLRAPNGGYNYNRMSRPYDSHKTMSFHVGDIVTVIPDIEKIKELQMYHGGWIELINSFVGKRGQILNIHRNGDLRVIFFGGFSWTFNPQCLRVVPGKATVLADMVRPVQYQGQDPTAHWNPANGVVYSIDVTDQIVTAARQGHIEVLKGLVEVLPHDVIKDIMISCSSLQLAAFNGHIEVVKYLLQKGVNVDACNEDCQTWLHLAASGNQPEVLDLIIKAGANLNARNKIGYSALHIAILKGSVRCIKILLSVGADPNCADLYGYTALHLAVRSDNFEIIDILCMAKGVVFSLPNKCGFNALHNAAVSGNNYATKKLLSVARYMVDVRKDNGFSALHFAAFNGHQDIVETLIVEGKADIDLRNNARETAFLIAVRQGRCEIIEKLVELKANMNARDENGQTALHILLDRRSNLTGEVNHEKSPAIFKIYHAIKQATENKLAIAIACYLVQLGADTSTLSSTDQLYLSNMQDSLLQELLKSLHPCVEQNQLPQQTQHAVTNQSLDGPREGYNFAGVSEDRSSQPSVSGIKFLPENPDVKPNENPGQNIVPEKSVECLVCSESSEENVKLEPCHHEPACEDCSARMKNCLQCRVPITRRVMKNGKVVFPKSVKRMRDLECRIEEMEETHMCSVCLEENKNTVFLCGHGTCSKCADTLKTCHMCRETITKKIRIY